MFEPIYLELFESGEIDTRIEQLYNILKNCTLCPRKCGVDRTKGEIGFCKSGMDLIVSSVGPHFGEEPELVGRGGSGTIFLTNCNLGCIYCQNYNISHFGSGRKVSLEDCADSMIYLQRIGCHNINLVTPTHFVPQLVSAIKHSIKKGLRIPIVYNCSGYENVETIKLLDGIVDIYMPDIKYSNKKYSKLFSFAENYFEKCKSAIKEMHTQVGDLKIKNGIAQRGLLIRHLVLPNDVAGSEEILKFIVEEISKKSYVNIMDQYRPMYKAKDYIEISRRCTLQEYNKVIKLAREMGLTLNL